MNDFETKKIALVRMEDGRWRVFLDGEDLNYSFQFPWDALQCTLNGSLTGAPISGTHTINIECVKRPNHDKIAEIRSTDAKLKEIQDRLRGLDGDGI